MRKAITLYLMILSYSAFADPTIFGMELGKTTEKDLKSIYNVSHTGINKYSNGNMYSVPVASIDFDGLKEVTTIFSMDGNLVAVVTKLQKGKFDYLHKLLGDKYKLVSQQIAFVGDKKATYRDGATEISLDEPHMSFDMSMSYINDDLMQAFNQKSQAEIRQNQQSEGSQL